MNPLLLYQIALGIFCILLFFALGCYLGHRKTRNKFQVQNAKDQAEMLTIERALKQFWDHEKEKLEGEKAQLQSRIQFLEERIEQYRHKAAGVGMMGLRKGKMTDMLVTLLIENENLEEKLYLQNLKLKQERDEYLENELRSISYKRILLSELISQSEVRREMERVINDKARWKRLELKQKELEPPAADEPLEPEKTSASD